ncbi:hypothetical protein [Arcobacter sp. CECT 8985]|uniref:hypothetical protein n=1 Tax=Arcobacter sp. CECT 8985 TaxID=1935424 RepID=UPI002159E5BC|nr:hypothetical protein [Arcobacter sp. CECT 8985]
MNRVNSSNMKIYIYIFVSLLFLSANSILCRMALLSSNIDAFSFTFVRIFSAAFLLVCLYLIKYKKYTFKLKQNWFSSFVLFLYPNDQFSLSIFI